MQALPPVGAAVLVAVAREELVEEFEDVDKHCFVVLCGGEKSGCGDGGRHFSGGLGVFDSHGDM